MNCVQWFGSWAAVAACGALWVSEARAQSVTLGAAADAKVPAAESAPSQSSTPDQLSAAPPAPAPLGEVLQGQAKSDYEAGRLLFDSGDYPRALLMFKSAYQATSDPRLLWNEAVCERSLRHYVKATNLVRQFLASQSPLITPDAASRAQAFLDAAVLLTAPLQVVSNEPDAEVYLDDEPLGSPALASQARVDLGTHRIVLEKRGFQTYSETVTVANSALVYVAAILRLVPVKAPIVPRNARRASGLLGLPSWAWIAGGAVTLAGIATASYFIFRPEAGKPVPGSIGMGLHF